MVIPNSKIRRDELKSLKKYIKLPSSFLLYVYKTLYIIRLTKILFK